MSKLPITLPVIFKEAVKALIACRTIDEAIYFRDKAEALKAWAKIYKLKEQEREGRALTLFSFRRMGELAKELRPRTFNPRHNGSYNGSAPGPRSMLIEAGLTTSQTASALRLAKLPKDDFDSFANSPRPPNPYALTHSMLKAGSDSWKKLSAQLPGSPVTFRGFCRRHPARELARGITPDEAAATRKICTELADWLDTFEQHLPKVKP